MMLLGYALLPLIVAALLLLGLRWNSRDTGWVVLAVTICDVSVVPAFHQTPAQWGATIRQGLELVLAGSVVMLPALFFAYLSYATKTCVLVVQTLTHLVPSRALVSLLLVFGIGPCLTSLCGHDVGTILILPLLACLHGDRVKAMELGLLSHLFAAWGSEGTGMILVAPSGGASLEMQREATLLLMPVLLGASLVVAWLSRRTGTTRLRWGTAISATLIRTLVVWLGTAFLTTERAGLFASISVSGFLLLRGGWKRFWDAERARQATQQRHVAFDTKCFLPSIVLLAGCGISQLLLALFPWVQTLHLVPVSSLNLPIVSWCLSGLWLLLGAFAFVFHTPLSRAHLMRVQALTWRHALPIVTTSGCFLITFLLLQGSGMVAILSSALEAMGVPAGWLAVLTGAVHGWLANAVLPIPLQNDLAPTWMAAAQMSGAWLASTIAPATILLAMAVTGATTHEAGLLRRIVLWGLVLLLCFTAEPWWVRAFVLTAAALITVLSMLHSGIARDVWRRAVRRSVFSPGLPAINRARRVLLHGLAYGTLVLVNVLYASSSLVSLAPLSRLDPLLFLCFQMLLLVPVGCFLLFGANVLLRRSILMRGFQLGACLAAGLLCAALSIKETGMMETTTFSCLNGVIAMLIARWLFGQRLSRWNWGASLCLLLGAFLVWLTAPLDWQGNVTAFLAGLLLTYDGFQVEQLLADYGPEHAPTIRAILGAQCLAMAALTTIVALCFGRWNTLPFLVPSDALTLCYLSFITILLPCALMLWAQRTVSAVTVACFSVIEPFAGMAASVLLAGERLPLLAWLGGAAVLVGMVLQMVASTLRRDDAA